MGDERFPGRDNLPRARSESGVSIGNNVSREAVEPPDFPGKDSGQVSSRLRAYLERHKVHHLGKSIDNDPKLFMASREWQTRDEVH